MYYTEEQIEEVRSKSDIVQIIGRCVNLKRTGSSYVGLCPFHSEKSPSFNVSPSRQMYKCFGCGVAGNVITFIMEYENYTFPEAMEFLAEQAGVTISKSELSPEMKREKNLRTELVQINAKAASYYYAKLKSPAGKTGYEYFFHSSYYLCSGSIGRRCEDQHCGRRCGIYSEARHTDRHQDPPERQRSSFPAE